MRMATLDDVTDFIIDGTHGSPERVEVGVPVLSATNVKEGYLDFSTERFASEEEYKKFQKRYLLTHGDILLTIVGTIGRAAIVRETRPVIFQRSVAILRPKQSAIDYRFLYHATQTQQFQYQLGRRTNQSSQAGIYLKKLKEVPVPLPPIEEQKRIAAILDQADSLRRLRQRAIDRLNTLGQAIFYEMFLSEGTRWPEESLSSLGQVITGATPPTETKSFFNGNIPFVTPGDLESEEKAKRTLSESGALKSRTVKAGSVLVCCIGATIGKMDIARQYCAFNQQINAVQWGGAVDDTFGFFALRLLRQEIIHKGKGSSTTLPILKKSEFQKLKIIVPPIALQQRFSNRMDSLREALVSMRDARHKTSYLFSSIQHRAFRGEL